MDGRFDLLSSSEQIEEITRVARYPHVRKLIHPAEIGWLINRLRDRATQLTDLPTLDISPDPADNFLFSMAEAGAATHLVTGDKSGVLAFRKHLSTHIITARQMVDFLKILCQKFQLQTHASMSLSVFAMRACRSLHTTIAAWLFFIFK